MNRSIFTGAAAMALGMSLTAMLAFSQAPAGRPQSPGWFLQASAPDPGGRLVVGPGGRVIPPAGGTGGGRALAAISVPAAGGVPACIHSPLCGNRLGGARSALQRVDSFQSPGRSSANGAPGGKRMHSSGRLLNHVARPAVAMRPERAQRTNRSLWVIGTLFMWTTDDAVRRDDRLRPVILDKP